MLERLLPINSRFLFGTDIFISYSRRDGAAYAMGLGERLAERGYDCFLDRYETRAAYELPFALQRKLRRSSSLALLATPGAVDSQFLQEEIKEFQKTGRPIVIIDFDHALQKSKWYPLIAGIASTSENISALEHGNPSESVVYSIERTFQYIRRKQRLQRSAWVAAISLFFLMSLAILAGIVARNKIVEANRALEMSIEYQREASEARAEADELRRQLAEEQAKAVPPGDPSEANQIAQRVVARAQREATEARANADNLAKQLAQERAKVTSSVSDQKTDKGEITILWLPVIVVVSLLLLYAAVYIILLYTHPLWILTIHSRFSTESLMGAVDPSSIPAKLAQLLIRAIGLDYFAKRDETRKAWLEQYRHGKGTFQGLPGPIKSDFIKHEDALDAWVHRRKDQAEEFLYETSFLAQRSTFVHLPIVTEGPKGQRKTNYEFKDFGYLFEKNALIEIVGQGGVGKSSFAGQLARWSLEQNPTFRLTSHYMIPVFMLRDTKAKDILAAITDHLCEMFGEEDKDNSDLEIIKELLLKKRILVIVDGLSERSEEMQQSTSTMFQTASVNALVVTTRYVKEFVGKRVVVLRPDSINKETLYYFISEYSNKKRKDNPEEYLPGEEQHEVNGHVMKVLQRRADRATITPLIVKLIMDQAVQLRRQNVPLCDLPNSPPDAIVDYLKLVNPQAQDTPNRVPNEVMLTAARILANCCLETKWTPRVFFRDEALTALEEAKCAEGGSDIVTRLIQNGVFEEDSGGGISSLRFSFDPVAEYLAALYRLDLLRGDEDEWKTWLGKLKETPGYPDNMQGFLGALRDCIDSYQHRFLVPKIEFPWSDTAVNAMIG